jgi:ribosome recycling factor
MEKVLEEFKKRTKGAVEAFQRELQGVRTNRPSPALLEGLKVDYYGQQTPIKQVGAISVQPPRTLVVQVWDKEAVAGVLRAIEASDLGVSAAADGLIVRVNLPELSEERRGELARHVKKTAENYRIQVRGSRDEANKEIQNAEAKGDLSEDDKFKLKEKIQEETERANEEIEKLLEGKLGEIRS